jgi:hypothetical protein
VLLLGWSGSQQKHFNKHVKYYEDLGMSTLTFIMPPGIPLFARDWLESYVATLLTREMKLTPERKFVVHSYSNNGMWAAASMLQLKLIRSPDAFISDAAPKFWYEELPIWAGSASLARVFTAIILNKNEYYHPFLSPLLTSTFALVSFLHRFIQHRQGRRRVVMDVEGVNRYARDSLPFPSSLFIYSTGDQLVPPEDVKEFIAAIRRRGVHVQEQVFGDEVAHTGSFYADNKAYMKAVTDYLASNAVI